MLPPKPNLDELRAQIKAVVLRESEDFFDEPEDLAVLQVTIRIACEFFGFLQGADGSPQLSEAEYMAGTIRSGMDEYVRLAQWGRIISGPEFRDRLDFQLRQSVPIAAKMSHERVQRQNRTKPTRFSFIHTERNLSFASQYHASEIEGDRTLLKAKYR